MSTYPIAIKDDPNLSIRSCCVWLVLKLNCSMGTSILSTFIKSHMQYINVKVRSTIKWHGRKFSAVRGEILQPVWFLFENYLQKIDEIRISIAIQITLPFLGYQFCISFNMRRDEETNLEKNLCKFNWIESRNSINFLPLDMTFHVWSHYFEFVCI